MHNLGLMPSFVVSHLLVEGRAPRIAAVDGRIYLDPEEFHGAMDVRGHFDPRDHTRCDRHGVASNGVPRNDKGEGELMLQGL